jgi:alkaline phosphatase
VTTTRITHATPAASYAHIAERDWEENMPTVSGNCKDIARQLIEDEPGSKMKVILGGGRRSFIPTNETDPSGKNGLRKDNRNLINQWINNKGESGLNSNAYQYVDTRGKLMEINYDQIEYLFGLFNYDHLDYEAQRNQSDSGEPSLEEMTESAIKILGKNENGFVLLVEGGRIDHAHHDNMAALSLYDTLAFDRAIEKAFTTLPKDETLIVVTADHSHSLTINGYPKRGNSIFGLGDNDTDSKPFTTLMYGNGPGFEKDRTDPSTVDTSQSLFI